jgi:medium-chain acyl-[acyl-carrier-protein] hydrolase
MGEKSILEDSRNLPVTLFCFPYSGASCSCFRAWVQRIPLLHICPVELPGHGGRISEPLRTAIPEIIDGVLETILPHILGPFAFLGHSMGALLSFEVTRYLSRNYNKEPIHLFVSGHGAPHLKDPAPPIHNLPDREFIEKIREMNGTDEAFFDSPELCEIFLPILRADFTACETYQYRPAPPLSCPITALGGIGDPSVPRAALEAWRIHTSRSFKVRMFPGDHFFLKQQQSILLEILTNELLGNCPPGVLPTNYASRFEG